MTGAERELGITVVILSYNEALHIRRCLERVAPIATRIVLIDSFSTDGTVEIAREMGAEVFQRRFTYHADQYRWGVEQSNIDTGWILRIDCDEYLEPALLNEIRERLPTLTPEQTAVEMRRKNIFQGQCIWWGGYYPTVLTRLYRPGAARFEQRLVDEHLVVGYGETVTFSCGDLVDENIADIAWWTDKHNGYTTKQMAEFISYQYKLFERPDANESGINKSSRRKRMVKNRVYSRSPLLLRAVIYYVYRYLFRFGFLDGSRGFVFHTLQGFWNYLLTDVKIEEAQRFIEEQGLEAYREHLALRHGVSIPKPNGREPQLANGAGATQSLPAASLLQGSGGAKLPARDAAEHLGITVVILSHNEMIHIRRCIERIRPIASRIVLVDSYSTDDTALMAAQLGAEVLQRRFTSHADQFRWGVAQADIRSGWILRIDCDEYLQDELIEEIRTRLPDMPEDVSAVEMRLRVYFQGKWIRWGGYYNTVLTRLWRVGAADYEQRLMDERVIVRTGRTVRFSKGDLVDDNRKDITFWTQKHNAYSTRHMIQFIGQEYPELNDGQAEDGGLNRQGRRKRFLRDGLYARAPLYLRPILYYLYRYFFKLGFLDGRRGFVWHTLQGFWHFLLIDVKVGEARKFIEAQGVHAFREHLARRFGIVLNRGA